MKSQVLQNRGGSRLDWVARSSCKITERPIVLFCPVVLQLAWHFNFWHAWHMCCFWRLEAASHPRDQVASLCFLAHSWAFQHSISLITLTTIPHKYRVINAEIQVNLAWNKTNKMVDYIQPFGMPGTCATPGSLQLQVTREIQPRVSVFLHTLEHFNTLSHSLPLQQSHINTGLLMLKYK